MAKLDALILYLGCLATLLLCTGCVSAGDPAPIRLSEPGWRVQTGQAVWKPGRGRPEIAGELFIACHEDGRRLVRFDKTPFPMVAATLSTNAWTITFPAARLRFAGHGTPPSRFTWLQLPSALDGRPLPGGIVFQRLSEGCWRMENKGMREHVEGYLSP